MNIFINPRYPIWVKKLAIAMICFLLVFGLVAVAFAFYMVFISITAF